VPAFVTVTLPCVREHNLLHIIQSHTLLYVVACRFSPPTISIVALLILDTKDSSAHALAFYPYAEWLAFFRTAKHYTIDIGSPLRDNDIQCQECFGLVGHVVDLERSDDDAVLLVHIKMDLAMTNLQG
jgi:hypothetical protein